MSDPMTTSGLPDPTATSPPDAGDGLLIDRRAMLGLLGAVGALAVTGGLAGCTAPTWAGVRAIGSAYVLASPDEGSAAALLALLPAGVAATATPPANLTVCQSMITEDFAQGRTVMLSGWILSVTEARVCALWAVR